MDNFEHKRDDLKETFKRLKGQPVEIITESGFKFCGIDVDANDDCVIIIDEKSRFVHILFNHIDAFIEPQKKLDRLCHDDDCGCNERR